MREDGTRYLWCEGDGRKTDILRKRGGGGGLRRMIRRRGVVHKGMEIIPW